MKMKENRPRAISFLLLLSFSLGSCTKNTTVTNYQVLETDAAAIIADNILPRYGGLVTQLNNSLSLNSINSSKCGTLKDSTLTGSNPVIASILFDYLLLWRYSYDCSSLIQHFDFSGQSNYEGYNYISTEQRNGNFTLSPKPLQAGVFECALSWKSSGKQRIKTVGSNTFNSTVEFTSVNVTIDQASGKVASGKLAVKMYDAAMGSFSFSGDVVFSGNNKASLILNSGRVYPLSW